MKARKKKNQARRLGRALTRRTKRMLGSHTVHAEIAVMKEHMVHHVLQGGTFQWQGEPYLR